MEMNFDKKPETEIKEDDKLLAAMLLFVFLILVILAWASGGVK